MTDTTTEAVERLANRLDEEKTHWVRCTEIDARDALRALAAERDALRVEVDAYRRALDPNETKHLYSGEFTTDTRKGGLLSWDLTKKVMTKIRDTAQAMKADQAWAAQAASADHKISPAPTRSPMNSIAPVPAQTVSADAIPAPLTSFEDTTHAWEEGYRAGREAAALPTAGERLISAAKEARSNVQNLHNAPSCKTLGWDAPAEFKRSADLARKALKHVCGDMAGRIPTVGRHEAKNHEHLRRIFEEAKDTFPRFADTLAWLLWHDILNFNRLAFLAEEFDMPAAPKANGIPHDLPISEVATWLLDQASRDYRQHEIDALRAAGAILAALEGGEA